MRTENTSFSGYLLTGTLLLAGIDVSGLLDYGLKALVGGGIWLAYKMIADSIDRRKRNSKGNE